jgi:predicted molibdopterin-dependent oxidoreductase YjgC
LAKLARDGLGSENVAVTNAASSQARSELAAAFGLGASTNPIEDIAGSRSILLVGADIEVTHPVAAFQVHKAANYEDATLVGIGPERYPELGRAANLWLGCLPGTEPLAVRGILATIVQEGLLSDDEPFDLLDGRDQLLSMLGGVDLSAVAHETGVEVEDLRQAARLFAAAGSRASAIYAPREGDTPGTASALAQLIAITGNVGHEQSGLHVFPSGGGNAEGAAEVGLASGERGGLTAVIERIEDGSVKALYWEGELPDASIVPEARLKDALGLLEFMVYQGTAPEPVLLEFANVVIAKADATEYDGTYTNAERRVQRSRPIVPAQQDVRPVWAVASRIGKALGAEGFDHSDAGSIFDEIAAQIHEYDGLSYSALDEQTTGPTWPLEGDGVLYRDGFAHADGKARLAPTVAG